MRTLILFRHAKAAWPSPDERDFDRRLEKRGRSAAQRMARFLTANEARPDLLVASAAARARETAELAAEAAGWDLPVQLEPGLYEAGPSRLVSFVRTLPDAAGTTVLVAHEPTLSASIALLCGGNAPAFSTGAVARLDFDLATWGEVEGGAGTLVWLVGPKHLKRFLGAETEDDD